MLLILDKKKKRSQLLHSKVIYTLYDVLVYVSNIYTTF